MGTFDIKTDASGLLRVESLNMTLTFTRTGPNTGRVSWNIPTPAQGCASDQQAYCGIVVTLDNSATNSSKLPIHGTLYSSDPNITQNIFAGDQIGTSKVIGAFYNDRTTTYFDITGLSEGTPYYISGFPVDSQYRYYIEGIHAYSLDYTNKGTLGTSGKQVVVLNSNLPQMGVALTDFTTLLPDVNYTFSIQLGVIPRPRTPVDPVYCSPTPTKYTITVAGINSTTYLDLITEINKKFALLDNSTQGAQAPDTGTFYWKNNELYQWNGSSNIKIPVVIEPTDPAVITTGTYWANSDQILKKRVGVDWINVDTIKSTTNPLSPLPDRSYWFDGTNGYTWNGSAWCEHTTIIKTTDPSLAPTNLAGSFWYNPTDSFMYKWNDEFGMWTVVTDVIKYRDNPYNLSNGDYWFNQSNNILSSWDAVTLAWISQSNVTIGERTPTIPVMGKMWYNPITQILSIWNNYNWVQHAVIALPTDPTIHHSCEIWWDTLSNKLFAWDITTSGWNEIHTFYNQNTDPSNPPIISVGTIWYNPTTKLLSVWKTNCFTSVDYFDYPANPTTRLSVGTAWYTNQLWYILNELKEWEAINPINSINDPTNLPAGTYWYDLSNNSLYAWNGLNWISLLYTTVDPTPTINTLWFNTTTNILQQWDGKSWIAAIPKAKVELDCHGNLLFTDNTIGSLSFVSITDIDLFNSLGIAHTFHNPKPGTDGNSEQPSYMELGIGTDGSADERLTLMNEIRYELGYPVVDVELTPEQLDYAITKTLSELRAKSGIGYKRGFFFMRTEPETQRYLFNNKTGEFNKIVDVLAVHRLTSSFLSSAHGAGVYGQIVLQHLYNMGTFDLLSYHIMAEYTKTMEILFAARLTFTWNEQKRELWIHHRFPYTEPYVAVEATVERTEQDIMVDRYARPWVRRYATAVARTMLAEIRGKYAALPGAGGNVTLNSADLRTLAKEEMDACLLEIDNYIVENLGEYGLATTLVWG